jgi:hypothetical protein
MSEKNGVSTQDESLSIEDHERQKQKALLRALMGTVRHFFGNWQKMFQGITDPRNPGLIIYPLEGLLCTGTLMYLFRLGARREINNKLRGNGLSRAKFAAWFGVEEIPHGDTLNYAFRKLKISEVQAVGCRLVKRLIRNKVLYRYRLLGTYYLVAVDGTGMLTFRERHCKHCLTKKLSNGDILYYHPVLEAKLVTENGFAFSLMTEFIENVDPQADKQDCELKAFYRLAVRLKASFPRLPICVLLDGLFACGPVMQLCEENNWKYLIVLQDKDLPNVQRTFETVQYLAPENRKQLLLGKKKRITQTYRWVATILHVDTQQRKHYPSVLECIETKTDDQEKNTTGKYKWLTNFTLTSYNVNRLANEGGRLRWKVENEGFNVQKNGGFNLEHPYSQDETAGKVFYFLLQIAYLIFQLMEKGSLFRNAFPKGLGSLKNIAFRLLEAWRNLYLSASTFIQLGQGEYQIRFDTS